MSSLTPPVQMFLEPYQEVMTVMEKNADGSTVMNGSHSSKSDGGSDGSVRECKGTNLETSHLFKQFVSSVKRKLVEMKPVDMDTRQSKKTPAAVGCRSRPRYQKARKSTNNCIRLHPIKWYKPCPLKLFDDSVSKDDVNETRRETTDTSRRREILDQVVDKADSNDQRRPAKSLHLDAVKHDNTRIQELDDVSRSSAPEIGRKQSEADIFSDYTISRSKSLLDIPGNSSALPTAMESQDEKIDSTIEPDLADMDCVSLQDEKMLLEIVETAEHAVDEEAPPKESGELQTSSLSIDQETEETTEPNLSTDASSQKSSKDEITNNSVTVKTEPVEILEENCNTELQDVTLKDVQEIEESKNPTIENDSC